LGEEIDARDLSPEEFDARVSEMRDEPDDEQEEG
jgi:hypothetical protein